MTTPFTYQSPTSLDEALKALSDTAGEAEILAGGSDLLALLKDRIATPKSVVNIKGIEPLAGIRVGNGKMEIGAAVTLADLADHAAMKKHCPALASAAAGLGSTQIRNVATVGGNLCQRNRDWYFRLGLNPAVKEELQYSAIFPMDGQTYVHPSTLAPVLMAFGASVVTALPGGKTNTRPIGDLFQVSDLKTKRETVLAPREIVVRIEIPIQEAGSANIEIRERQTHDWPLVQAAAVVRQSAGNVKTARVVLGHIAPVPKHLADVEKLLVGKKLDEALATEAGKLAAKGASPTAKNEYKVRLVEVAVKRALLGSVGNEYWRANA